MRSSWIWGACLAPGLAWVVVFAGLSVVVLFGVSLGAVDLLGQPVDVFGDPPVIGAHWENWDRFFSDSTVVMPIVRSFLYAGAATLLSLLVALPASYTIARYGGRWKLTLIVLILIPFWTNYLVQTYSWLVIVRDDGLMNEAIGVVGLGPWQVTNTPIAVIGGLFYAFLPFMLLPVLVSIDRIPRESFDVAADLYARPWARFVHITLPLAKPGIIAGCIFNFLPGFGDFVTADMLGGPNTFMLGNFIELQVYGGIDFPYGAVLSFALLVLLSGLIVYYLRAIRRQRLGRQLTPV